MPDAEPPTQGRCRVDAVIRYCTRVVAGCPFCGFETAVLRRRENVRLGDLPWILLRDVAGAERLGSLAVDKPRLGMPPARKSSFG